MKSQVELLIDAKATLGEGPCWHAEEQALYWVDILEKKLHRYDPATGSEQNWLLPEPVGCVAARKTGGLIIALQNGFAFFDPQSGTHEWIRKIEADLPATRFNDGKCDPKGRFWAGTMDTSDPRQPIGSLYCFDTDRTLRKMETHVTVSNGLTWNPDYTVMYYIDTGTRKIVAYDYDLESGDISGKRVIIEFPETVGYPDGMTADQEGMLWVAMWGGWKVARWNPNTGDLLATYDIPAKNISACCFGGPDLSDLYITTARKGRPQGVDETQPHAGGLFRLKTDTKGLETFMFAG